MRLFPLLTALVLSPILSTAMPVEVSHPVANFLRRLEEKGAIRPGFWSTLPRSESEVAAALASAVDSAHDLGAALSDWDRRRVERYLDVFDPERKRRSTRLRFEDSVFTLRANVEYFTGIYAQDSVPNAQAYAFGSLTPGVEGTYREHIYFSAQAMIGSERNQDGRFIENYNPQRGMPYGTGREGKPVPGIPQEASTFDGFRTLIGFSDGRLSLEAGQDWNQWGPGRWQHSTLSARPHFWSMDSLAPDTLSGFNGNGNTYWKSRRGYRYPGESAPLPQIRLRFGGDRWEYVKVVAQRTGLSADSSVYLVAHRVQLRLGAWKFGATEMLTIGTQSPDLVLMVPGIPLKFAEHSGGDKDNSSISGDVEWTWTGHGRIYGELFLDDYSGPPLSFRGNKFALVAGASWQDPFDLPAELHVEYAQVDPWTYGHHLPHTAMQHYGALLGSSLPPNARALWTSADFPLPYGIEGSAEWHFRQRDLKSRGSSIFNVYDAEPPAESTEKAFLEQDVETRNAIGFTATWQYRRHALLMIKAGAGGLWVENYRGNPGVSLATPTAFTELTVRY
jgi:hypothetical protein